MSASTTAQQLKSELATLHSYWHSPIDLGHGINTKPGPAQKRFARRLELLQLPTDLRGKRVLDVGTWDGFFALELERRGADVVAIDIWDDNALRQLEFVLKVRNSKVVHRRLDVHEVSPQGLGTFDLVLCAGVLYHARHPLLALERLRSVAAGMLILETVTLIPAFHANAPLSMFFPGDQEANATQWPWAVAGAVTLPWLRAALRSAGFGRVEHVYAPSFYWWKRGVALATGKVQSGRSVTHAFPAA